MRTRYFTSKGMVFGRLFLGLVSLIAANAYVNAQALTGPKSIPGNYATIAAAVADLNTNGVGSGGVTFSIAAGYTETITAPISITATGTSTDPIVFQKAGAGVNPLITAYVGTSTPGSAAQDGIWNLVGSDYVTIDGIDLYDPNTTNPATMEYGYGLFKSSASNGAQRNTITNCVITMSIVNNAAGSGPAVDGSRGINVVNSTVAAATTALSPSTAAGANSFNRFYSNTIKNCNVGISIIGFAASSPFTAADNSNDIGGTSALTGNTILNFGGATAASNPAAGIRTLAQYGINVSYNTLNSNDGTGANHPSTLRGIFLNTATSASGTCNNNTVTIKGGGTTSTIYGIHTDFGSTAASNTININNNTVENCTYTTATSGVLYCIYAATTAANLNINGNVVRNSTVNASTGTFYGIGWTSPTNLSISNNQIYGLSRSGAGTTYGIQSASGSTNEVINNNTIYDLTNTSTSSTSITIIGIFQNTVGGIKEIRKNTIYNLSAVGSTATGNTIAGINILRGTTVSIDSNSVYGFSGTGATVTGINIPTAIAGTYAASNNKIYDLSSTIASPLIMGISASGSSASTTFNIFNNLIGDLKTPAASAADAIRGISITATASTSNANVYYNTIYLNASSSGTNFGTSGIYHTVSSTATTATLNLRNNVIVNASTPAGTGLTVAYRRSGTALDNYGATSNNNLFYAGTPGATRLIFYNGTNGDQTLSAYKTRMTTRDQGSVTENPNWVSTSGTNSNFLNINTAVNTQIESRGVNISTYTYDFGGNIRQGNPGYPTQVSGGGTAPDIGAWEFDGMPASAPSLSGLGLNPGVQCVASSHTVSVTVTNTSGSISSVVINYSVDGVAQTPISMTNTSGSIWEGTIPAATPGTAKVIWSVTATNTLAISATSAESSYSDEPLTGAVTSVNASVNPACSGAPVQLTAVIAKTGGTATVGAGALTVTSDDRNPFYYLWGGMKTQYLVTAAELRAAGLTAGNITSIALNFTAATGQAFTGFAISMDTTLQTALTTTFDNTLQQVFNPATVTPVIGTNTYTFNTPFNWNGTNNIVIQFCWSNNNSGSSTNAPTVKYDAVAGYQPNSYYRVDGALPATVCAAATASGATSNGRPQFVFGGTANMTLSSYSWSDGFSTIGTGNPLTVNPTFTTSYTFTASDANGCSVSHGTPYQVTTFTNSLSGVYNVGAGQTYTTLTAAVDAYNNICNLSGPVTFLLTDASYGAGESFPITINNHRQASSTNTLTIQPAMGVSAAISGSSASSIISLNAAKYVTINGSNNGTNSRNLTVSNTNSGTSSAVIWMQNSFAGDSATHNTISNVNVSGNSNTTTLVGIGSGAPAISNTSLGNNNNSNTIWNCRIAKVQYGIYFAGASVAVKNQNNVIDSNELNVAAPDNIQLRGILVGFENNIRISKNKIGNIISGSSVMGISLGVNTTNVFVPVGNEVTNALISRNVIGPVTTTGATTAFGIVIPAVTSGTNTLVNNSVFSVRSGATPSDFCAGIYIGGGTGSNTKVYFNSVSLSDVATRSTPSAYAIAIGGTDPVIELKNNIFYNVQTSSNTTPGNSYAIGYNSSTFTNLVSDYNVYYTAGANAQFAVTGGIGINTAGTIRTNLAALKTATGKDANSISIDPTFNSTTNLVPMLGSSYLGGGVAIAGITTDLTGATRAATPSIGAYENGADQSGPSIVYTALTNDFNPPGYRTVTGFAAITDGSGINVTSGTKPRMYYKKKGDANVFAGNTASDNGWKWVESSNNTSPFDFVIDYNLVLGGFVTNLDTIQYFVVAQDNAAIPNVTANPSAGFAGTTVANITSAPSTLNQYIIVNLPPLSGSYDIGAGLSSPNYPTITAAINDLGLRGVSSAVVFNLVDAAYNSAETFPIVLPVFTGASATNTVTIKPAAGVVTTIRGTSTAAIFKFANKARYYTIDGSNNGTDTRNLAIQNASTATSSVVWFEGLNAAEGVRQVVLKNTLVKGGSNSASIGVLVGGPTVALASNGLGTDSITITNNNVYNCYYGVVVSGASATNKIQRVEINRNDIGTDTVSLNNQYYGVYSINTNLLNVHHNHIYNQRTTSTLYIAGIQITDNTSNGSFYNNRIHGLSSTNSGGYGAYGINVASNTGVDNDSISNNVIYDLYTYNYSATSTSDNAFGIRLTGGSNLKLYYNSVHLYGQPSGGTAASASAALLVLSNTYTGVDIRNNMFVNSMTGVTTGSKHYSFWTTLSAPVAAAVFNYNNFFASGTHGVLMNGNGTDITTLAALRTATGANANSINVNPVFSSPSNLAPTLGTAISGGGVSIPGITTDFTGSLRGNPPSIGAYENGVELAGPVISYNALFNDANPSGSRTLTGFATITDYTGVNVTSGTKPRIYYKKKGDANAFVGNTSADNGWKWVEATNTTSPFDFVIDYSLVLGGFVSHLDTIQYFVVAQDNVTIPNVSANPSAGFSATDVATITSAPTTLNQYLVINMPALSGNYNIGTGLSSPDYPTIKAALADLTLRGISSSVVFNLVDAAYGSAETFPITIVPFGGAGAGSTVTIKPAAGVTTEISGTSASSIINLNAAKYVIIDGSNNGTTSRNLTISNTNSGTSSAVIWIQNSSAGDSATHNTISNVIVNGNSNTTTLFGIGSGGTTIGTSSLGNNNNSNVIRNCKVVKVQYGIYSQGASAGVKNHNNVIDSNELNAVSPDNIQLRGILVGFENNINISKNKVGNMTATGTVMGISMGVTSTNTYTPTGNEVTNALVSRNIVGPVTATGGTTAFGIAVPAVTSGTSTFTNNVVFSVISGATPSDFCAGIYIGGGSGSSTRLYFNTVSLSGVATRSTPSAYAIAIGGTDPVIELKNNIFYNVQTSSNTTPGNSYAIGYNSSAFTNLVSDYNLYYTSGANAQFAVTGGIGINTAGTIRTNIAALRTATGGDANSVSADPGFVSTVNLIPGLGTPLLGGGVTIPGITTDITGTLRNNPPSMGAYENGVDLGGPAITYSLLSNDFNPSGSRTLSAFATITDYSGVNVTSGTKPRIYYKKKGNADAFAGNTSSDNGWKWVEASNSTSPFSFVINYNLVLGGSVSNLDTIQYFVVAQDNVSTPNVSANPSAGFAGTSVAAVSSAPSTLNQYIIVNLPPLSGSYNIGAGLTSPNYATISAAFNDLSLRGASAAVTFNLVDASYTTAETFPLTIAPFTGSGNTVTLKPAAGVTTEISGSSATSIINLNAAKYVIIDGSNNGTNSRNLTVSNTNSGTSSAVIWINSAGGDSATRNSISNVIVNGNSNTTTLFGIGSGGAAIGLSSPGSNNNNNVIRNCKVSKVQIGIYSQGSPGAKNQNNIIDSNELNVAAPDNIQLVGILAGYENNIVVRNNKVGNILSSAAATALGISLGVTSTNTYAPSGNEVTNALVEKNVVGPVTTTANRSAFGIAVPPVTSGTNTLVNNSVFSIISAASPADFCAGIYIGGGAGSNTKLYFNSVSLSGASTRTSPNAYAIAIGGTDPAVEMKNNIFYNTQTTSGVGNSYAIGYASSAFTNLVSDYNLYYTSGSNARFAVTGGIGDNTVGTIRADLAALKTATGKDASSKSVVVNFVSATDLHLTGSSRGDVSLVATPIAGITTDIDGETRNASFPYMGADEVTTHPLPVKLLAFSANANGPDVLISWVTASETNNYGFTVERSVDGKTFTEVGFRKGAGNSKQVNRYQLNDRDAFALSGSQALYYRLRQTDIDGNETLSKAVLVRNEELNSSAASLVYPNPFVSGIEIELFAMESSAAQVTLVDIAGRVVLTRQVTLNEGVNHIEMENLEGLDKGIYFIHIMKDGKSMVHKLSKN